MSSRLIFVGGFLGAGKTTLLWECARRLASTGKKIQLITNDQASTLVDTAFLEKINGIVSEVSGSCFCCNFNGLTGAIATAGPNGLADIIIAEPVGSCTDLSATLVQPLKDLYGSQLQVSPLTVLADPSRLSVILYGGTSGLHESAAYILRKQLEEADLIVISKNDLLDPETLENLIKRTGKEWPLAKVLSISSVTGEGMETWLAEVMESTKAGTHLADVDYDIYAEGEAVLGWLNVSFQLASPVAENWDEIAQTFMQKLESQLVRIKAPIGHIKMFLESGDHYIIDNLTGGSEPLCFRGEAVRGKQAKLTVNARVQIEPNELESIVQKGLEQTLGGNISLTTVKLNSLSPGRPNPTHRYDHVV